MEESGRRCRVVTSKLSDSTKPLFVLLSMATTQRWPLFPLFLIDRSSKRHLHFCYTAYNNAGHPPQPHRHVSPFQVIFTCTGIKSIHASLFLALARHDHFFIFFPLRFHSCDTEPGILPSDLLHLSKGE